LAVAVAVAAHVDDHDHPHVHVFAVGSMRAAVADVELHCHVPAAGDRCA
jgi:hypothetical protein